MLDRKEPKQADWVEIICEAGVNHNGSVERALELIDRAAGTGADVVKFQTYRTDSIATSTAPKAAYQDRNAPESRTQQELLKSLELDAAAHIRLQKHASDCGIMFLSTPFDLESLGLLTKTLGLRRIKVSSGDLTNAPLLLEMARARVDIILSTGMATMTEIEEALSILAFGYLRGAEPSRSAFAAAYMSEDGRAILKERVTILHCTSDYPANIEDVNLRAMTTLSHTFGLKTGYSDHTTGIEVAVAAAAMGAKVIEKHMTLDRTLPGPDQKASLEPTEFAHMVNAIRIVCSALGSSEKRPTKAEMSTRRVARKAVVAARAISSGERFTLENLTTKRAGGGPEPIEIWDLVGRVACRSYGLDEAIETCVGR